MQLTVYNGSPRGKASNTEILLGKVVEGIQSITEANVTWLNLSNPRERAIAHESFPTADLVLFGFPLYTDAMPGLAKEFIESLAPYCAREANPRMAFLVQSGFPEACQSRPVERYLEKLASRLNAPYAGTIVKGGCEGVRMMPEQMNRKLFTGLLECGAELAQTDSLDPEKLHKLAKPERYSKAIAPLFKLVLKLPMMQSYWNNQLKENGAFEKSFARPFDE
jgi:hypothetical protein